MRTNKLIRIFSALIIVLGLSACRTPEKIAYFQDTDTNSILEMASPRQITIRPGDKLSIIVKSKDHTISDLFNLPVYSTRIGLGQSVNGTNAQIRTYTNNPADGIANYTVSPKGDIDFPVLGTLHIEGMTRSELSGFIKGEIMGRDLAKDPTVIVEFLSTGIDVLGDVRTPGRYDMNKDEITLLDALSLAGDLNVTGQRTNVKVIRLEDGKMHTYKIDLTDAASMAKSPAFYLRQGDVVYVEPNEMMKRASTVNGNNALSVGFWISVASLLTSVVTTVAVFINR